MYQDFGGACGFYLPCSPGGLVLVISQKTGILQAGNLFEKDSKNVAV
jgi:hypothetical protein